MLQLNIMHSSPAHAKPRSKKTKAIVISVVILIEIVALLIVASTAWVETVSSIKLYGDPDDIKIEDTYVFSNAAIGEDKGTIDLGKYFRASGDMHLAPAISYDGSHLYFPNVAASNHFYRKGTSSDMNVNYLSISFQVSVEVAADFFFTPETAQSGVFSALQDDFRISVTSYSRGSKNRETKVYAFTKPSPDETYSYVDYRGETQTITVDAISNHIKGKTSDKALFTVGAEEVKIVTVSLWLKQSSTVMSSTLSQLININNFGLTSSLTPRRVTLIPTWDWKRENANFYAWCWMAADTSKSSLYKLELNDEGHYSFDYNGKYDKTVFFRSGNADLTKDSLGNWSDVWNQTVDTSIPNYPIDPFFFITSTTGGESDKSTGIWLQGQDKEQPATVKVAYVTGQDNTWGTLTATSYVGNPANYSTASNNKEFYDNTYETMSTATGATNTHSPAEIHAVPKPSTNPVKTVRLTAALPATNSANYQFVGWYNNAAGTGSALSTSKTFDVYAPEDTVPMTYYAKFKEVRTITLMQYKDGSSSTGSGTIKVALLDANLNEVTGKIQSGDATSQQLIVDKGATVRLGATAKSGYTLKGIYTSDSTQGNSRIDTATNGVYEFTANNNQNYYAHFTTNSYTVTAHAYYSTDNGSSYTADDATGGTVKVGSAAAGATSAASVKYKSSVNLVAAPKDGYEFVGWYDGTGSSANKLSSNTTYSYTLNSPPGAKDIYARFIGETWSLSYGVSGASNWSSTAMTVSNNIATGTLSLTAGQEISFKICKTVGTTNTWYGSNNSSYIDIIKDTVASNVTLSTSGGDMTIRSGRAGTATYTFSYNISTNKLTITASGTLPNVKLWSDSTDNGSGSYTTMSRSASNSNVMTCTKTLTEGADLYFKVNDQTRSKWYTNEGDYDGYITTTIVSDSALNDSGSNMHIKGHAGTYTFSFDYSTKKLSITVSFSNITLTLYDNTNGEWLKNDSAKLYFKTDEGTSSAMSRSGNTWTVSIPSNYCSNPQILRKSSDGNTTHNTWNCSYRYFITECKITDSGFTWRNW